MGNLKGLNERLAQKHKAGKAKKKPSQPAPAPVRDDSSEKVVSAIGRLFEAAVARIEKAVEKVIDRPDPVVVIDEEKIGAAVARQFDKLPRQDIKFPERKPVSYRATIERRGNQMVGARIDPITE